MRRLAVLTILLPCVLAAPALAHEVHVPNGSFERAGSDGGPAHWYAGEPGHAGYEVQVVRDQAVEGRFSLLIRSGLHEKSVATASRDMPPGKLAGRQVTLSGYIRTSRLTGGRAGLWLKVYSAEGEAQSVSMQANDAFPGPEGTTPWQRYALTLAVTPNATGITYGVIMDGTGAAWFDDLRMEVGGRR